MSKTNEKDKSIKHIKLSKLKYDPDAIANLEAELSDRER